MTLPRLHGQRWVPRRDLLIPAPCLYLPREGVATLRSGQALTFSRTGPALAQSDRGRWYQAPSGLPRTEMVDLNGDKQFDAVGIRLDPPATNVAKYNNDLSQSGAGFWVRTNTGAVAQASTMGKAVLWRITDSDAVNAFQLAQPVTGGALPAGDCVLQFLIAKGNVVPGSATRWRLIDTTNGNAVRINCQITGWTGNVPTISYNVGANLATTSGLFAGYDSAGREVYWVAVRGTGLIAAAAHTLEFQVALTGTSTGDVIIGLPQLETGRAPTAPILTTTASASRNDETFELSYQAAITQAPFSVYKRFVERGGCMILGSTSLRIGETATSTPSFEIRAHTLSDVYLVGHHNGTSEVQAILGAAPVIGNLVEHRAIFRADGSVLIGQRINGGAETTAGFTVAHPLSGNKWWAPNGGSPKIVFAPGTFKALCTMLAAGVDYGEITMDQWAERTA